MKSTAPYQNPTEEQKQFIRDNHQRMTAHAMQMELGVSRHFVRKFMDEEKLPYFKKAKTVWIKPKKREVAEGFFQYNKVKDNWVTG